MELKLLGLNRNERLLWIMDTNGQTDSHTDTLTKQLIRLRVGEIKKKKQ